MLFNNLQLVLLRYLILLDNQNYYLKINIFKILSVLDEMIVSF